MQKAQRILMLVLPIVFIPFVLRFPAGLMLYWMTTNLWTVGQGLITRRLVPKTPVGQLEKKSSRTPPKASDSDEGDGGGNGAKPEAGGPKPAPARSQAPRKVRRKKKAGRR
jgi:YidC/Oxa1 family membrane protein insertase